MYNLRAILNFEVDIKSYKNTGMTFNMEGLLL